MRFQVQSTERGHQLVHVDAVRSLHAGQLIGAFGLDHVRDREQNAVAAQTQLLLGPEAENGLQAVVQPGVAISEPRIAGTREIIPVGTDPPDKPLRGALGLAVGADAQGPYAEQIRFLHLDAVQFQGLAFGFLHLVAGAQPGLGGRTSVAQRSAENLRVVVVLDRVVHHRGGDGATFRVDVTDNPSYVAVGHAVGGGVVVGLQQVARDIGTGAVFGTGGNFGHDIGSGVDRNTQEHLVADPDLVDVIGGHLHIDGIARHARFPA